ncbi:glycoside hydrolase superfamily [Elsinoe ampelina]|uniref:chitinase n=1 Tax=Elsinoe ampelina TaxID=302913 RepID=A0A6A6GIE7_9PEZI|nr:glycoside hydrolase superfamily [Elsinoe ampelina]
MIALSSLLLASLPLALAGFSSTANTNVAVYWGQNSYGQGTGNLSQQSLATYCRNSNVDIIPMAFLTQMTSGPGGEPVLNFANQQNGCGVFPGTQLIKCPNITKDIKTCQNQYGKTILLSIGGATYGEGGFSNNATAKAWADKLWAMFGPKQTGSSELRPFGNAVIDGFDMDMETTMTNSVAFAQRLRTLMNKSTAKKFYLTAAPQCPYPDHAVGPMLANVGFDAIFVQFYNNYCGLQSFTSGTSTQNNFNYETWDAYAKTVSKKKVVKIFLGVPAGPTAAGSGYKSVADLRPIINYCKQFSSFGGVMSWDLSQAMANSGFLGGVKKALKA